MDLLESLVVLAKQLDRSEFAQRYSGPYLIRQRTVEEIRGRANPVSGLTAAALPIIRTPLGELFDPAEVTQRGVATPVFRPISVENPIFPEHFEAYRVEKSDRNVFADGVTIGRTQNNDVVVPLASVSKFHAWLTQKDGAFYAHDARSRFGTFIGAEAVPSDSDEGALLASGAVLRLGEVPLTFYDAERFHQFIGEKLAGR
jgi:hypothetical protein